MGELEIGSAPPGNSRNFRSSALGALGLPWEATQGFLQTQQGLTGTTEEAEEGFCTLCTDAGKTKSPSVY